MVAIGDVVEDVKSWNPASLPQPVPIRYIDLSAVDKDAKRVVPDLVVEVLSNAAPSRARQLVATEDVLVSTVRPNLNGVALLDEALDGATASTGYCVLRSNRKKLEPKYLRYWVETTAFVDEMTRLATGASYPAVSDAIIKNSKIPLPPLPEQRRIAAILDKAQALVANDKRTLAVYDQLAKSLFLEMFGDPVRNERGWEVVKLGVVVTDVVGGESVRGDERPKEANEWAVLKISAVTRGVFDATEYKVADLTQLKRKPITPKRGDLLFSRANTREMVGATCVVDIDCTNLFLPDKLWRLDLDGAATNAWYLHHLLHHAAFRASTLGSLATGTSGSMLNISKAKLLGMGIPLPPFKDQKRFSEGIEKLNTQRTRAEQSLRQSEALFGSLLQGAFSGGFGS